MNGESCFFLIGWYYKNRSLLQANQSAAFEPSAVSDGYIEYTHASGDMAAMPLLII